MIQRFMLDLYQHFVFFFSSSSLNKFIFLDIRYANQQRLAIELACFFTPASWTGLWTPLDISI